MGGFPVDRPEDACHSHWTVPENLAPPINNRVRLAKALYAAGFHLQKVNRLLSTYYGCPAQRLLQPSVVASHSPFPLGRAAWWHNWVPWGHGSLQEYTPPPPLPMMVGRIGSWWVGSKVPEQNDASFCLWVSGWESGRRCVWVGPNSIPALGDGSPPPPLANSPPLQSLPPTRETVTSMFF